MGVDYYYCVVCARCRHETYEVYRMKPPKKTWENYCKSDPYLPPGDYDSDECSEKENFLFPDEVLTDTVCEECSHHNDIRKTKDDLYYWKNASVLKKMRDLFARQMEELDETIARYEQQNTKDPPPTTSKVDDIHDKKRKFPSSELTDPPPAKK